MKKLLLIIALLITANCYSQTYPKSVVTPSNEALKSLTYGDVVRPVTFSTMVLPISLFRVTQDAPGHFILGQELSIGTAYVLGSANSILHVDSSITISETWYYGVCSVYNTNFTDKAGLTLGVIGGFNQFSVFGGRDLILNEWVIAIAYSLNGLPFFNGVTKITQK